MTSQTFKQTKINKIPKEYSEEEVLSKIKEALGILYKRDRFLLEKDVNERSISHKLAEYLQQLFQDYNVDCEYNWQTDEFESKTFCKELLFTSEEEKKFYPKTEEEKIKDKNAHTVYPDIIVHQRGSNLSNLLIIEIKKSTNLDSKAREKDKLKLEKYKEKFHYTYTLFLDLPTGEEFGEEIKIELNEDGEKI
jgi:hypothetical protein